ncbi:hypothetical protein LTS18_007795 [Coniosporium uncinatum]|uniref:Uncharacterized protein n=1 Tax=Coniosporium uncinatum TaxID=93489 RepID=A0ACC3DAC0_9PEZI|nr:hypothetical protein LTS18_007795 [Coniosporium uncinatum]
MPSFRKLDVRVTTLDGDLKNRGGGKKPRDHRDQQKDYTHKLEEYGVHGYTKGNAPSCIAFIESVTDMVFRITIKPELPFDEAFRDDSVASTEHVKHEEDIKREEEYDQDMISLRTGQPMRPAARKARDTWRAEHEAMRNLMPGYDRHGRYIGRKGKDYGGPSATYLASRRDHGLDAASNHPTSDPGYYGGNEDDHMEEDRPNIKHESNPARDPYFKQERTDEDDADFTYDVNEPTPSPRGSSSPAAPAPKAKWHLLASLYLDGRKVPERQTMIYLDRSHEEFKLDTDGEITMRSRWVKNRDGTISSMAWVFADVGVETMLDKLFISAADAAANTNDEDDIASALETAALDQREEEQAKPQMGQIVVVFERVTVTQTFEDEEYTGGRYDDEFDDASGKKLDKDVTHTAA